MNAVGNLPPAFEFEYNVLISFTFGSVKGQVNEPYIADEIQPVNPSRLSLPFLLH